MKTLPLTIELSKLAIENSSKPLAPKPLLKNIELLLAKRTDILGKFTGKRTTRQRRLGSDLTLCEFRFDFEKSSFHLQIARLRPRQGWQVQGFRFS